MKKRLIALTLAIAILLAFAGLAGTRPGTVVLNDPDSYLRVRKSAPSGTIIAYLPDGASVTIIDEANPTSGFFYIRAYCYTNHYNWTGGAIRTGYASSSYIDD